MTSSPGLWNPVSTYTFFKPIDALLDRRSDIVHVTSNVKQCIKRTPNYDGDADTGLSLATALKTVSKMNNDLSIITKAWGAGKSWLTGDIGITACGWGDDGQA